MSYGNLNDQNPHTERQSSGAWQVVYWKANAASGRIGADRAELEVWCPGAGYSRFRVYELPKDEFMLDSDRRALGRVFDAGKRERSRQLRMLLDNREGEV